MALQAQFRLPTSAFLLGALAAASASLLYRFPPETTPFYPRCPIYALTGLLCPGCGATRAIAALLHAHWADAFHANSLVTILLPFIAIYCVTTLSQKNLGNRSPWPKVPTPALIALFLITVIFTIQRNLV